MAKAYSDDLRRKILQVWEEGEETQEQIGEDFRVSARYIRKILYQQRQTGQRERVPHHPGRKPLFTPPIREQMRVWLQEQPDLTLVELQEKLRHQSQLRVSLPSIWVVLKKKMGLRLKKSRSMLKNKRPSRSGSSARYFSKA
jgi:transposase